MNTPKLFAMTRLEQEFIRIKNEHKKALLKTSARVVLGSSVIRVFREGTSDLLRPALENIPVDDLLTINNQEEYKIWFEPHLKKLAEQIKSNNPERDKPNIYPGYQWGHAAKVLNLFLREIVEYKRYFSNKEASRIRQWLYMPIDRIIIERLQKLGIRLPFKQIKGIDTAEKFYSTQDLLNRAARAAETPRIWFDDVWGDRQNNRM
jgi:hypothetical protein